MAGLLANFVASVLTLLLSCQPMEASTSPEWDLSYQSLLKKQQIESDEWLAQWLATHKSAPVERTYRSFNENDVFSSVLLEYPAFHAGERLTFLFIRTSNGAYCWSFVDGAPEEFKEAVLDANAFDVLMNELDSWTQAPPLAEGQVPAGVPAGYFAFLSTYNDNVSRQILLTLEDFKQATDPQWDNVERGRVYKAFDRVLRLYD